MHRAMFLIGSFFVIGGSTLLGVALASSLSLGRPLTTVEQVVFVSLAVVVGAVAVAFASRRLRNRGVRDQHAEWNGDRG